MVLVTRYGQALPIPGLYDTLFKALLGEQWIMGNFLSGSFNNRFLFQEHNIFSSRVLSSLNSGRRFFANYELSQSTAHLEPLLGRKNKRTLCILCVLKPSQLVNSSNYNSYDYSKTLAISACLMC